MAVYFLTGKLGSGKSLAAVGRIRDYLRQGRRVATNLDLRLDHMMPPGSKATVTRVPDKPRVEDLVALGTGDDATLDEYDEGRFGLLVLDELGSWFNARTWSDKSRGEVIEWFLHARKYHWDVILIVQDVDMVDKQLRDALCEHLVICRRLDRLAMPLVGGLYKLVTGRALRAPKLHVASVYYGQNAQAPRVDRWWYRGADLYGSYRTGQVFMLDQLWTADGPVDVRASSTMLSAWHLRGRYLPHRSLADLIAAAVALPVQLLLGAGVVCVATLTGRSPVDVATRAGLYGPRRAPVVDRSQSSAVSRASTDREVGSGVH